MNQQDNSQTQYNYPQQNYSQNPPHHRSSIMLSISRGSRNIKGKISTSRGNNNIRDNINTNKIISTSRINTSIKTSTSSHISSRSIRPSIPQQRLPAGCV